MPRIEHFGYICYLVHIMKCCKSCYGSLTVIPIQQSWDVSFYFRCLCLCLYSTGRHPQGFSWTSSSLVGPGRCPSGSQWVKPQEHPLSWMSAGCLDDWHLTVIYLDWPNSANTSFWRTYGMAHTIHLSLTPGCLHKVWFFT